MHKYALLTLAILWGLVGCERGNDAPDSGGPPSASMVPNAAPAGASSPATPPQAGRPGAAASSTADVARPDLSDESSSDEDEEGPDGEGKATAGDGEQAAEDPGNEQSDIQIKDVGMRIVGGANDAASKARIRSVITKHHDDIRACFKAASSKRKAPTIGVDLSIGRRGGNAKVRGVRTGIKGKEFHSCLTTAFQGIEFPAPPGGKPITVSYSIQFVTNAKK